MSVTVWWIGLGLIGIFNVAAVLRVAATLKRTADPAADALRRRQLQLAVVFVVVCAFRSLVPRADVQRICLFDSWLATVFVGRALATVAELSFAAQWMLLLREVVKDRPGTLAAFIPRLILPLITAAEVFSWYATLTTNYGGNSFEESTWALVTALMVLTLVSQWSRFHGEVRRFLGVVVLACAAYFTFLCAVDVPMYVSRWHADRAAGRQYLSLRQGLHDSATRAVVTHRWEDWREEIPWMTLYFSVGPWLSMALVRAPYPRAARRTAEAGAAWAASARPSFPTDL
jgi:hypothetical protein